MTDKEYTRFLIALYNKHICSINKQYSHKDLENRYDYLNTSLRNISRTAFKLKLILNGNEDNELISNFINELEISSPIDYLIYSIKETGAIDAFEEAGAVIFAELRMTAIPKDDYIFLRNAGFTDDEIEVFLAVAINKSHALASNCRSLAEKLETESTQLPALLVGGKKEDKKRLFNGIGKIIGGVVTGIGNGLIATGTIMAPNPAIAYTVLASMGIGIAGVFSGIGDLSGE